MLQELNPQQRQAVTYPAGPLLIVAGAGTGKTMAITKRLAWLILQKKVKPENILALTFTEKAAEEMEERVDKLLPYGYCDLWIETFHSFCDRILKENALDIGLDPNYKLLTQAEQWIFIKAHLFEFDLDYYRPLGNPNSFIFELIKHFSRAKDEDISPNEYLKFAKNLKPSKDLDQEQIEKTLEIANAYKKYQDLMIKEGNMDFGDLIINALNLFRKRKHLLKKYQQQFQYILVDEFQDTNYAQYKLLQLLSPPQNNLTAVFDDDQAIYRWRGASVTNVIQFLEDLPKTKKITLINNYRTVQPILDLAYVSIQFNNPDRLEAQQKISKKLKSNIKIKIPNNIEHIHKNTLEQEAVEVINNIINIKNLEKSNWSDFAILVRANASADIFINLLSSKKIPYQFIASKGLYSQPEIMDLISYLRVINNFYDDINFYRVLSLDLFNIKEQDIAKLLNFARRKNISLFDLVYSPSRILGLEKETPKKLKKITDLLQEHAKQSKSRSAAEILLSFLKDSGYLKMMQKPSLAKSAGALPEARLQKQNKQNSIEVERKILNISLFFKKIQSLQETKKLSIQEFINYLDLTIEAGEDPSPVQLEEGPDSVKILTIHSAKGLEFDNVFIVNMVEDKFPSRRRRDLIELPEKLIKEKLPEGDSHIQEERRLFYVAMTRAKKRLFFTSAEDYGGKRKKKISRFLKEIKLYLDKFAQPIKTARSAGGLPEARLRINIKKSIPIQRQSKIIYQLPSKFSYTQLKAFDTCPYQYRFAHVLRVPSQSSHTFSYGKTMHAVMQKFYQELQKGKTPSEENLLDYYQSFWINDFYLSKIHEQKRKKQGQKALQEFYKLNKDKFKKPLFLEKGFNLRLGKHILKGKIDRIDKLKDNTIEIIDYKTGKPPKDEKSVSRNDQLLLYSFACQQVLGLTPSKLSLYYIDQNKKLTAERDAKKEEKVICKFKETINKIKNSQFTATPGYHCKFCDYKDICEYADR